MTQKTTENLIIHHLGVSQSDRVIWLMEELELSYKLVWHNRSPEGGMPQAYLDLHPAATAPTIQDGARTLTESVVILEYICHTYGEGKLTVGPNQPNYYDYLYWMQFNNNVLGLFFAGAAAGLHATPRAETMQKFIKRREDRYYAYLEEHLGKTGFLAGDEFTCADIMVVFNLTALARMVGKTFSHQLNTLDYIERIGKRPAYIKAMQIAGPEAKPPGR